MSDDIVTRLRKALPSDIPSEDWDGFDPLFADAIDEIERLRAAHGWQPIETALEGDLVLCWCPKAHRGLPSCEVLMVYHGGDPVHASGRSYWTNGGPNGGEDIDFAPGEEPTHWQPLPKEAP